jgi:hypothetical protein
MLMSTSKVVYGTQKSLSNPEGAVRTWESCLRWSAEAVELSAGCLNDGRQKVSYPCTVIRHNLAVVEIEPGLTLK